MGLARELEKRLERLFDGVSGAIFRGRVRPVDLGTRLLREADLSMSQGKAGPVVANDYVVALHPEDIDQRAVDQLARELAYTLEATAALRGWRLEGPARVVIELDDMLKPNHLKIAGQVAPGSLDPWGQLIGSGRHADLGPNRVLVGRANECDIRFDEPEISRRHAVIHREQKRTWVTDLGSANGTEVDGDAVTNTTPLRPGAQLTLGPARFMFRLVEP